METTHRVFRAQHLIVMDAAGVLDLHASVGALKRLAMDPGFDSRAEVVGMIQLQRYALAAGTAALHLLGSLALTILGLKTAMFFIAE